MKRRFFPDDATWQIERGSILDKEYLNRLRQFDIVYSWGVLHHTGDMWGAIRNATSLIHPGGTLAIGIYNFKGGRRGTITWQKLKRWYCAAPKWKKETWEDTYIVWNLVYLLLVGRNPVTIIREYKTKRNMSWFSDVTDWLGGYPSEAAAPGAIPEFVRSRFRFALIKQNNNCDLGFSEFVFGSLRR